MSLDQSGRPAQFHVYRRLARALLKDRHEFVNTITHGLGLAAAVPVVLFLVVTAARHTDLLTAIGCSIFGASLLAVYGASTLSHAVQSRAWKHRFRVLDQAAIYLLISGTYTAFAFRYLTDGWWWALTAAMWGVALIGCISKLLFEHRIRGISVWLYLLLGWMPLMAAWPIMHTIPTTPLVLLLLGGCIYSVGVVFLMLDKKEYHFHAIWHLLVMLASAVHVSAVYFFVAAG